MTTSFGARMRALMAERGLSLGKLSKTVHYDTGYLSRISRDLKPPSAELAGRLDEALGADGALVALVPPPRGNRSDHRQSRTSADMPILFGGVDLPCVNGRPVDAAYVESIRETNQMLVRLDSLHSANDVLPLAVSVFRKAHHKIGAGAYVPEVERDLMAAAGETGEVAAWLAYDADRQAGSRQLIHEALMLSRQAGDRDMELFELSHMAMQSLHLYRPAEALRIAGDVLEGGNLAPRVEALFDMRRGRALAQMGASTAAFNALDKASATLTDGVGAKDPHWTWWLDDTQITVHKAIAHTELGQWERAVPLYEQCLTEWGVGQHLRLSLAQLLQALVHVRDWGRAEDILTEAAGLVDSIGPGRAANLLRKVADRIALADDGASSVAKDTAAHLRRVLGEEPSGDIGAALR